MKITMQKLNKHFFPLVVALVLFFGICAPVKVNAAYNYLDYADLDYSVKYGSVVNTVSFPIGKEWFSFWWDSYKTGASKQVEGTDYLSLGSVDLNYGFDVGVYPASIAGFSLNNMPAGTRIFIEIEVDETNCYPAEGFHNVWQRSRYYDSDRTLLSSTKTDIVIANDVGNVTTYLLDYTIENIDGAVGFVPFVLFENYTGGSKGNLSLKIVSAYVEMEVSKEFWSQFQNQQNGKLLNDMVNGTNEQHSIVNDSVQGMEQAGNKLDSLGDQLNSVEKPNVDTFKVGIVDMIGDSVSVPMLTAPIREIWESPVALGILTIVVTLVLVSWVFFGKKK